MKVINFWKCNKCKIGEQIAPTWKDAVANSENHDKEAHKSKWMSIFGWRIPTEEEEKINE